MGRSLEEHYQQSIFIREIALVRVRDEGTPDLERLHAIVVPDIDALRSRRIVNVGELIRFEIENASVLRPPVERVAGFEISMAPLPRTDTGALDRERLMTMRSKAAAVTPSVALSAHVAVVVHAVERALPRPTVVTAASNFELDLGLDSLERAELFAVLERQLGARVSEAAAQCAFTVQELADALQSASVMGAPAAAGQGVQPPSPWPSLLRQTSLTEEQQALLLRPRWLTAMTLFVIVRALAVVLLRPTVRGVHLLPAHGPCIICPNHQSFLDPLAVVGALPFRIFRHIFFVGAAEYFATPWSAWCARHLNIVPVDPDANLVSALQAGAFGLRHGKVLMLFPEGERSIDGNVRPFKRGVELLAEYLDVAVVPVALDGLYAVWPRNRPFAWRRLLPWSDNRIDVTFGAPLPPAHRSQLRAAVERLFHDVRRTDRGATKTRED